MWGETEVRKSSVFENETPPPKEKEKEEVKIIRKHCVFIGFPASNFFHTSFRWCERSA